MEGVDQPEVAVYEGRTESPLHPTTRSVYGHARRLRRPGKNTGFVIP
jgi:hypothetical protein